MKIQELFNELEKATEGQKEIFTESGMLNCYKKMRYGFFPLGLGVLKEDVNLENAEMEEGGIMVLGNDFGTVKYVQYNCKYNNNEGEHGISKTIDNLLNIKKFDVKKTFFTNFYLGARLDCGDYYGTTMTKRMFGGQTNKLKDNYKKLCYDFFIKQLQLLKPRMIICLGHDVKDALIELTGLSPQTKGIFDQWESKHNTFKKIYEINDNHIIRINENETLGTQIFVTIPHPCDLRNFTGKPKEKLIFELTKLSVT
jgi:uracil-DNA glycosylase